MSTSVTQFIVEYSEFAPMHAEDSAFVAAVLARAERRISMADAPAGVRDDFVYLTAAHMLALSPMGRNAQLSDGKTARSVYGDELALRKKGFAVGRSRVV